jgi:hypothetical protein
VQRHANIHNTFTTRSLAAAAANRRTPAVSVITFIDGLLAAAELSERCPAVGTAIAALLPLSM